MKDQRTRRMHTLRTWLMLAPIGATAFLAPKSPDWRVVCLFLVSGIGVIIGYHCGRIEGQHGR